jgi:phosphotransferase system IIB component
MKDGASKSFEQAYNGQIASDEQAQVIVGTNVTPLCVRMRETIPCR